LFEERDGWRRQAFVTNTRSRSWRSSKPVIVSTPVLRTGIRPAKDTGRGRLPSREYEINQAWRVCVAIAADLVAWPRLHALTDELAAAEPKALAGGASECAEEGVSAVVG
jgi:hypothetical protein